MKTPGTSTILHLAGKMKRPKISITHRSKRRVRPVTSLICFSVLFTLLIATAFYSASSASTRNKVKRDDRQSSAASGSSEAGKASPGRKNRTVLWNAVTDLKRFDSNAFFGMLLPQASPESIETYAASGGICDFNTPKDTFNLGEQVCARVANAPLRAAGPLRRISISGTDGSVASAADVISDPQTLILSIPTDVTSTINGETVDNRGIWIASINSTADYGKRAVAFFSVAEPGNDAADLAIYSTSTSSAAVEPGQATGFSIWLTNDGPNAAQDVHVTQTVPANMTFVPAGSGNATFACTEEAGVVDCVATSLASGVGSRFTLNYTVGANAPNSIVNSDIDINGETTDPRTANNSSTSRLEIRGDSGPPATCSISCPPNLTVNANTTNEANESGAIVNFTGNIESSGDCGSITTSPASGSFFKAGTTTTVDVSSTEGGGACSFTITVVENTPPTITCQANIGVEATDACNATVAVVPPEATGDGVEVEGVRSDGHALNDPYPGGITTITWTATDSLNRKVSCQQTVTVTITDETPPTITAPENVTIHTPGGTSGNCGVVVGETDLGSATASDTCAVNVTRSGVPAGNFFPIGTTTITYTAKNLAGLTSTATQTVTVIDTTPPIIVAPPDASYTCMSEVPAANPNQATAPYVDANGNTQDGPPSDNCGTPTVAVSETSSGAGSVASPRVILRTFSATDGSGNTASATQTITVTDPTPPTIGCPANITTYLPLNSTAVTTSATFAATASDNCEAPVVSYNPALNSSLPVGTTTVTATATDGGGNTASCTFDVTVLYNFTGFFAPVNNLPTSNVVNAGKAIPVKFSLSGDKGLNIFAPNSPSSGLIICNSSDPATDLTDTVTAGGSSLSYDASTDQYVYVWKTESSWAGTCRQLVVTLNDGSIHRANFKFK
jgi:uncharacterized repeat protein (TIGR01451 family)